MTEYKGFLVAEDFNIYNVKTMKKLTPYIGSDGYLQVVRRDENKHPYHIRVHVLFAHLFIPNPNNYKYVNHIDSNKLNNSLENLEWCTNSYNVKHGWDSGNRTHKNKTHIAVYKDDILIGTYSSIRECGKELHLDRHKIARILKGELPENYWEYRFSYN